MKTTLKALIIFSIFAILSYAPLRVALADFSESNELVTASLSANVSSSQLSVGGPVALYDSHNNLISDGAFAGSTGIMSSVQNSGANSIVQQSVIVKIDALTIGNNTPTP